MKKIFKTLAVCAVAGTLCAGVAAFAGCGETDGPGDTTKTYTGEYKYANAWTPGAYYGVKVEVTVKGDKIAEVKLLDCDYTVVTPTWSDKAKWDDGIAGLLKSYEGKTVAEIKAIKVSVETSGQPSNGQELGGLLITGATQGSGRLLLAVQNALNEVHTGEAWGLVHGAGYAGYASITYTAGAITDVTLSEVCLPTHVTAGETVPETDKVVAKVLDHGAVKDYTYYKTVSYGDVTMTYDATLITVKNGDEDVQVSKGYMVGTKTLVEYFQTEKNVLAYYNAVMANNVSVTIGEEKKKDVMTKAALSKEENGYWTREDKDGNEYSRWKMNRDATVKYVKENGVDKLLTLAKSETESNDVKEDKTVKYWTDGTVSTGATWTDLNTKKDNTVSYAQLIVNANTKVSK